MDPLYAIPQQSLTEIDKELTPDGRQSLKSLHIFEQRYPFYKIDKVHTHIDMIALFEKMYQDSIGFTICQTIVEKARSYKETLESCLVTCEVQLERLILNSFKEHRTALNHYANSEDQKGAIAAMGETGKIGQQLAEEYRKLSKTFERIRDDMVRTMNRVSQAQSQKASIPTELRSAFVEKEILALQASDATLWKIQASVMNMSGFLSKMEQHSSSLGYPKLDASTHRATFESDEKVQEENREFHLFLERREKEQQSAVRPNSDSHSVMRLDQIKMKTGENSLLDLPKPDKLPITRLINAEKAAGVEREFEKSYLEWLTLGKVHHIITQALQVALYQMELGLDRISKIEEDPLVKALNTNPF